MNTTAKIALAASGGYLLGRTKKMKLALAFAMFLAGQKLPKSPIELVQQGAGALAKNDQFQELSHQVTGSLLDAGKAAAGRSAERWLTGVGDRLRDGLPGSTDQQDQDDEDQADEDQDDQDEATQDENAQDENGQDEDGQDENGQDKDGQDEAAEPAARDSAPEDSDQDSDDAQSKDSSRQHRGTSERSKRTATPAKKASSGRSRTSRSSGSTARKSSSGSSSRAAKES